LSKLAFHNYRVLLVLITLSLVLFAPILGVGYLSDDYGFVYQLETFGWKAFEHNFNDPFFIPISHFIATVFYFIVDGSAIAFHLLQLIVHGLIAWQLFLLLKELKLNSKFALLAAIIFIVLPYQSESVVWLAAKSYGYALFFSVLSIRYFFKWYTFSKPSHLIFHLLLLLLAIHSKEMGYCVPLVIPIIFYLLYKTSRQFQIDKKKWLVYIGLIGGVFTISLLLRFFVLQQWIGGYGSEIHAVDFSKSITHLAAWIFKYASFYRYALENGLLLILTCSVLFLLLVGLLMAYKKTTNKGILISGFLLLFTIVLLPVLNLEITSVKSIASERYGYFASVIVALVIAFALFSLKGVFQKIATIVVILSFTIFIQLDLQKWRGSSEVCQSFLGELVQQELHNKKVLLVNVPDNFAGSYCLRNGIEEYLKVSGVMCEITPIFYQTFTDSLGGVIPVNDSFLSLPGSKIYYVNPNFEGLQASTWNDSLGDEYDKVYYYLEQKLHSIK
jgi:hypothetical protein